MWWLTGGGGKNATSEAVKTRGNLTTNDGEIAVSWALDDHRILMRAERDSIGPGQLKMPGSDGTRVVPHG